MAWMALVSSMIWLDKPPLVLLLLLLDCLPLWSASAWRFPSARFTLIITKVDRNMASSDTIMVSSQNGQGSTRKPIQAANQMMWI
jgi:hypothetical protein